jgi:Transposase IS66 family
MGKAVSYALGQWKSLEVYLKESEIEIDNNLVEKASGRPLLERKTGYFSAMPMPVNAARSSTQSSKAAGVTASSPTLICTTY